MFFVDPNHNVNGTENGLDGQKYVGLYNMIKILANVGARFICRKERIRIAICSCVMLKITQILCNNCSQDVW